MYARISEDRTGEGAGVKRQVTDATVLAQARRISALEERIDKAEARVQEARLDWARTVREFGISATARHYGITPQAITSRLQAIEGREN